MQRYFDFAIDKENNAQTKNMQLGGARNSSVAPGGGSQFRANGEDLERRNHGQQLRQTGSHAAMEKEHGIKDAKDCTLGCVKGGAKYVLYSGSKAYNLDDQSKPEAFAGQKVKVTGTLDSATDTIHVQDIKR